MYSLKSLYFLVRNTSHNPFYSFLLMLHSTLSSLMIKETPQREIATVLGISQGKSSEFVINLKSTNKYSHTTGSITPLDSYFINFFSSVPFRVFLSYFGDSKTLYQSDFIISVLLTKIFYSPYAMILHYLQQVIFHHLSRW